MDRQNWLFRVELPADIVNPGRYMAALLKHLLRRWSVRATAVLETPDSTPRTDR